MIKYRVIASCQEPWREQNACFLNISMGQQYHEGDKFISLLHWASQKFDKCMINIGDSIHRHNIAGENEAPEDAYRRALKLGDEWLARNGHLIEEHLSIPYEMKRWDEWVMHPDFLSLQEAVIDYYEQNDMFKASIEADIRKFIARMNNKSELIKNLSAYMQSSTKYLLEECAVYLLMVREFNAVRVYPAVELECLKFLKRPETPHVLQGMEHSIHINVNFKKRKSAFKEEEEKEAA